MKIRLLILLLLAIHVCRGQQKRIKALQDIPRGNTKTAAILACNNWLYTPSNPSYFDVGQINIPGNQITVEATINRTTSYAGGPLYAGDVVSKHDGPTDVNYLLRPNTAEITTTDAGGGVHYFVTPAICEIDLNKTYHVAMTYDGTTLKFYRNGFLMSQVAASGNLYQNNWRTRIGYYESQIVNTQFIGYINEVRIWNVARTQADIRSYMASSLPSPATQTGLVAYYTFDNLLNKQGNTIYNGTLGGSASIINTNPNCTFTADSCDVITTLPAVVTPSFTTPDTVCVNTPVTISNTTAGASSFYWNFCVADLNTPPAAVNLGNIGGYFSQPTFIDYVLYNNNYYGFVTNYQNGNLVRLDFGNNLLNTPTAIDLGNFAGMLTPTNIISEGIQMIFNEGKWYAIIVGSANTAGTQPRIFKVEFGANVTNTSPVATDWGNIGNLAQPIDLHVFKDGDNWYGFTANSENNTITRFNFTNSFDNIPTAVNLGNLGNLSYPTGIYAISDNGFWRVFVVNGGDNTTTGGVWSLSRLDFGNSLLNTPTAINLGNPGNTLHHPRDITIMKSCGQTVGFVVNGNPAYNDIVKLDFNNNLSSTPAAISLGNIGNLSFPHSISRLFRINDNLYSFITNAAGSSNSITRLQFTGCTNASISSSTFQNPPAVTYNTPGTYHINLSVDDGLSTQNAFCKEVVVLPPLIHSPLKQIISCTDSIKIGTGVHQVSYLWNTGAVTDSIYVKGTGTYWVTTSRYDCSNIDSFTVAVQNISVKTNNDTAVCKLNPVLLNTSVGTAAVSYQWSPPTGLSDPSSANPVATPAATIQYIVTATDSKGCTGKDSVLIMVNPSPLIARTNDTTICHDKTIQLYASGGNTYSWLPSPTLSNINIPNPVASPATNTTYYITVTSSANCVSADSIKVAVTPLPMFEISSGLSVCKGSPVQLAATGGDVYAWDPADGLNNPNIATPVATPVESAVYTVKIIESTCKDSASLTTYLTVLSLPQVQATSSNDINCTKPVSQLNASGAFHYLWKPAAALNDSTIAAPLASPSVSTSYILKGTDLNGCVNYDTLSVLVTHAGDLLVNLPNAFTPNGDGKNDCFGISRYAGLLQHVQFSVYDRFGVRIFYTTNPLNCWDGRYKGTVQDAGGFAYVLQASTFCGEIFKKGVVMLLK